MPRFEPPKLTTTRLLDLPSGTYDAAEVPTGAKQWYRFASSYKYAADALSQLVLANDAHRNLVALPVLFLYRHYVEVHLKSLLLDAGELLDDLQQVPQSHYLLPLWHRVRTLLIQVDSRSDNAWLGRADQIIGDLDALDPTSFAFRYPVGRMGAPALPVDLVVDLGSIASAMAELHFLLDGASTQIDVYIGHKAEMREDGY